MVLLTYLSWHCLRFWFRSSHRDGGWIAILSNGWYLFPFHGLILDALDSILCGTQLEFLQLWPKVFFRSHFFTSWHILRTFVIGSILSQSQNWSELIFPKSATLMKGTRQKGTYSTRINGWSNRGIQQFMTRENIIAIESYLCYPNQRSSDCI